MNRLTDARYLVNDEGISQDGEVCDERYIDNLKAHVSLNKRVEKLEKDFADLIEILSGATNDTETRR